MRRIIPLLVVGAALALPSPAWARSVLQTLNGAGQLRVSATGSSYGNVASGQIWVLDRTVDGKRGWSVYGAEHGPIRRANGWYEFRGKGMTFSTSASFSLKILNATGIDARITADGSVYLKGSGKYSLNSSSWRRWPSLGRWFAL